MKLFFLFFLLSVFMFLSPPSYALISPEEQAQEARIETQAKSLFTKVRCLVCDNQTIESSQAEFSKDLRNDIRSLLQDGKTEQEIFMILKKRYGDEILYTPPFDIRTYLLWFLPFLFLLFGFVLIRRFYGKGKNR